MNVESDWDYCWDQALEALRDSVAHEFIDSATIEEAQSLADRYVDRNYWKHGLYNNSGYAFRREA